MCAFVAALHDRREGNKSRDHYELNLSWICWNEWYIYCKNDRFCVSVKWKWTPSSCCRDSCEDAPVCKRNPRRGLRENTTLESVSVTTYHKYNNQQPRKKKNEFKKITQISNICKNTSTNFLVPLLHYACVVISSVCLTNDICDKHLQSKPQQIVYKTKHIAQKAVTPNFFLRYKN